MHNKMDIPLDFHAHMAKLMKGESLANDRHHVLVACMPKSGSTFLAYIISSLPEFRWADLVNGYGRREQEIDVIKAILYQPYNYAAQHHVRYSGPTEQIMRIFNIKPIVLVRNIFDVVISFRDHIRNESTIVPTAFIKEEMKYWENDRLEELIVSMIIPWYFNFFMCWTECPDKLLLNYDEHIKGDISSTIEMVVQYLGLNVTHEQIEAAINIASQRNPSKNKAKTGRGEVLKESTKQKIIHMANYYEGQDFSVLGIK
jgi:hypothetical protein